MARVAGAAGTRSPRMAWAGGMMGSTTPEAMWLWVLVGLELVAQVMLRRYFRRQHGG